VQEKGAKVTAMAMGCEVRRDFQYLNPRHLPAKL